MTVGAGSMAASGLISGIGKGVSQYAQGKADKAQADLNATIAETQGVLVTEQQKLNEFKKRKAMRNLTGEQVALYAKSGVTFSGSAIDVVQNDIADAELDIAIDKINARMGASAFQSQADADRAEGRDRSTAANLRASQTVLSSVAKYGEKYSVPGKNKKIGDSTASTAGETFSAKGHNITIGA